MEIELKIVDKLKGVMDENNLDEIRREIENKAPLMEGLDGLIDKEIIGKKLIQQLDGKKIYVYYFSPSSPNDLSFRV